VSCDEKASALLNCERAVGVERLDSWGSRCVWGVRGAASEVRRRRGELARARLSVVLHPRGSERARGRTPLTQHSRRCASIGHSSASPALRSSHRNTTSTSGSLSPSRPHDTRLLTPASYDLTTTPCICVAAPLAPSLSSRARTSPTHSAAAHTPRRPSPAASAASAGPRPRLSTCLG
jgi:hypothetical protein